MKKQLNDTLYERLCVLSSKTGGQVFYTNSVINLKQVVVFLFLGTKFHFAVCTYFPTCTVNAKLYSSPFVRGAVLGVEVFKSWYKFSEVQKWIDVAGKHASF